MYCFIIYYFLTWVGIGFTLLTSIKCLPHLLKNACNAFGSAPDFDKVEENLAVLYSKIKDSSQKAPIEKILSKAIQKLRTL